MFKIIPNKKNIGAELVCDLNKINNSSLKKIKSALSKYGMIYFRNQKLSSDHYVKFAKKFGKLFKRKFKNEKCIFSSEGPISVTRLEREKEKGKKTKELISKHKLIRKINSKYTLYCSPGHFIRFNNSKIDKKFKTYLFKHQLKKSFQYSLEWEKNQLAIWDNRSMLHQATAFKGNRIMHRITVQ